jgi:hypothetical protein
MVRRMTDKTHASFMAWMKKDFARDRKRLAEAKKNKTGIFAKPKRENPNQVKRNNVVGKPLKVGKVGVGLKQPKKKK